MATYLYQTIPSSPDEPVEQFEFQQSMNDDPLTHHPETGKPVRRVITGGFGLMKSGADGGLLEQDHSHPAEGGGGYCCGGGACGHS